MKKIIIILIFISLYSCNKKLYVINRIDSINPTTSIYGFIEVSNQLIGKDTLNRYFIYKANVFKINDTIKIKKLKPNFDKNE